MNPGILEVRVSRRAREAIDIDTFELASADGSPLPAFSAGSHIDVHLPNGLVRQYSLCNDPAERHRYVIGVLRDPKSRGGSSAMHDLVQEGTTLRISAPKNHFPLAGTGSPSLLLAGGIGITPILCMAERLAAVGADFSLHYCTRSRERTAFLARIEASSFRERVEFHFDDAGAGQAIQLDALLDRHAAGEVYVCGPKGFMDAVLERARARGWPPARLHYEFFAGAAADTSHDGGFEVKLASSGRVVWVDKDTSVVQALAAEGMHIETSCEQGVCGTCLTRLLDGEADHRDLYLTPDEQASQKQFLPCCSRAKSPRLVLDL